MNLVKSSISVNYTVFGLFLDSFLHVTFWILKKVFETSQNTMQPTKSYQKSILKFKVGAILEKFSWFQNDKQKKKYIMWTQHENQYVLCYTHKLKCLTNMKIYTLKTPTETKYLKPIWYLNWINTNYHEVLL